MKWVIRFSVFILCAVAGLSARADGFPGAGSNIVFALRGKLPGTTTNAPHLSASTDEIINAAMNQAPATKVPKNLVLAFTVNCDGNVAALTVYDTTGHSNVFTIATADSLQTVVNARTAATVWFFEGPTSSPFPSIFLGVTTVATLDANGCASKVSLSVNGGFNCLNPPFAGPFCVPNGKWTGKIADTFFVP